MCEMDTEKFIKRLKENDLFKHGGFFKKKYNFSQVSNVILDDEDIPIETKGLYAIIQRWVTYYDDSRLEKEFIRKKSDVGVNKFDRMWQELKIKGYLKQYRVCCGNNRFIYVYDLLDTPDTSDTNTVNISITEFNDVHNKQI